MHCPKCHIPLSRQNYLQLQIWGCGECGGRAATPSAIKTYVKTSEVSSFFEKIKQKHALHGKDCPICKQTMGQRDIELDIRVDGCLKCRLVWFDAGELEEIIYKSAAHLPPERALPPTLNVTSRFSHVEIQKRDSNKAILFKDSPNLKQTGLKCPRCKILLIDTRSSEGKLLLCSKCSGNLMRYNSNAEVQLRNHVLQNSKLSPLQCTSCEQYLRALKTDDPRRPEIDICLECDLIWFDKDEISKWGVGNRLPWKRCIAESRLMKPDPRSIHSNVAVILEMNRKLLKQTTEDRKSSQPELGLFNWKHIPALFLLPIERDEDSYNKWPLATYSLAALFILIFFIARENPKEVLHLLAFVPHYATFLGTSFLTCGFVHLEIAHLVGNLYFFITFADTVELKMGPKFMLILFCGGIVAGSFMEWLFDPGSKTPMIGASAGVSAVIVFYCIKWSSRQFSFTNLNAFTGLILSKLALIDASVPGGQTMKVWFSVPAWVYLIVWTLLQIYGVESGHSQTAYVAHLGGGIFGFFLALIYKPSESRHTKSVKLSRSY